jgi:hypothetical protein
MRVLIVFALWAPLLAQTPDTAILRGQVVDQTHAAVPGVSITVVNKLTGLQRNAQTDSSGHFSLSGLPVDGNYDLSANKEGFAPVQQENVRLSGGSTADFVMQLSATGGKTEIMVTGTVGTVSTDDSDVGIHLDARQMEETPLPNRRITFLPLLNAANRPAINQGDVFMNQNLFTTNGTGRRQAWFEVDGANAVDSWGRQTIFTNLQLDNLAEMSVISNSVSAEYGRTAGSVVNIVTKSGGNQYHGDLIGVWRPADAGASLSGFMPTTANGNFITSDSLRQVAGVFSGPIGSRQKTHFLLSTEYSWQNRVSPITSTLAPGSFVGHYRDWLAFLRVDHEINDKNTIFLRSNLDQFTDTNPNGIVGGLSLPSVDRVFKRRTYTEELGETAVLSPTLLNNVRLQFQLASPITQFDPVIFGTQFVVPIAGNSTFTTGTSQSALLQNRQYEVNDTLSAVSGRHTLTFGGDVIRAHTGGNSKEFGGPISLGSFKYNTCTFTVAVCESPTFLNDINNVASYTQSFGNATYTVDDTLWSLFVQDDFHFRPNLTLNLGLRYERQTFTDSTKDFAPRVGFSYNVRGDGKTVIRGGFGIYYSQIVDNSEANYALTGPTGVFNFTAMPGQIGFPTSIQDAPLPVFPTGAAVPLRSLYIRPGQSAFYNQFLPTSTLRGYQSGLLSPYTEQWTLGFERELAQNWILSLDYVGSHSVKINRPLDVDPPAPFVRTAQNQTRTAQVANCERPLWISFYQQNGQTCDTSTSQGKSTSVPIPLYSVILADVNDGVAYYNALDINLNHRFSRNLSMLASYTWSHAIDNVDPDIPGQNPNDPNFTGRQEIGNAIFDQRQRFVLSGVYVAPLKINIGGVGTLGSGLPFNIVTGTTNSGDTGATTDRPVVGGSVIPRNAGRGRPIYDVSPFIERAFGFGSERIRLNLRAEAFNVFNHNNFVGYFSTFGNGAAPANLGQPAQGITNQLPARSMQFSARLSF